MEIFYLLLLMIWCVACRVPWSRVHISNNRKMLHKAVWGFWWDYINSIYSLICKISYFHVFSTPPFYNLTLAYFPFNDYHHFLLSKYKCLVCNYPNTTFSLFSFHFPVLPIWNVFWRFCLKSKFICYTVCTHKQASDFFTMCSSEVTPKH